MQYYKKITSLASLQVIFDLQQVFKALQRKGHFNFYCYLCSVGACPNNGKHDKHAVLTHTATKCFQGLHAQTICHKLKR